MGARLIFLPFPVAPPGGQNRTAGGTEKVHPYSVNLPASGKHKNEQKSNNLAGQ